MKTLDEFSGSLKSDSQQKRQYEKPRLGNIALYADQVLGPCNSPLGEPGGDCTQFPGSTT